MHTILRPVVITAIFAAFLAACLPGSLSGDEPKPSLKVLLVAGGCCHDYSTQSKLLKTGIEQRLEADVTVVFSEDKATTTTFPIYESDDWADGFAFVVGPHAGREQSQRR
ncbi:MAG: hypothetical protein AAGA03_16005, partial [Planctomycetota bacterium]